MTNDCAKYRDQLLEAALTANIGRVLESHLRNCTSCTAELAALRERRGRMDALLPLVARGAQPSDGFRTQVLSAAAATDPQRSRPWKIWALAGVTVALLAGLTATRLLQQKASRESAAAEIAAAQKLAEWRAPSDVLLETPGIAILQTTPKLGESYLKVSAKKNQEN